MFILSARLKVEGGLQSFPDPRGILGFRVHKILTFFVLKVFLLLLKDPWTECVWTFARSSASISFPKFRERCSRWWFEFEGHLVLDRCHTPNGATLPVRLSSSSFCVGEPRFHAVVSCEM